MPAMTCVCPQCRASLTPPPRLPATLQCAYCRVRFVVPAGGAAPLRVTPAASPRPDAASHRRSLRRSLACVGLLLLLLAVAGSAWVVIKHFQLRAVKNVVLEPAIAPSDDSTSHAPSPPIAERPAPEENPLAGYVPPSQAGAKSTSVLPDEADWSDGLSNAQEARINRAIDRGVTYLKGPFIGKSNPDTWAQRSGGMALTGLTLLSCDLRATDPVVRDLAARVRAEGPDLITTYDLALALLFLDRLGAAHDRDLIRLLAARLVAGQNASGGWTYTCPRLSEGERDQLLSLLKTPSAPERAPPAPHLKELPVLRYEAGRKFPGQVAGDNSNTQFAILAVWASRRHGVPAERTLALVDARFRATQNADGSWGYQAHSDRWPDSMTCAGLLGLAAGHGVLQSEKAKKTSARDPAIANGLRYLGKRIGWSPKDPARPGKGTGHILGADAHGDLYFLWSVERVGVLYDLRKVGGKDWYPWGAAILLDHQNGDGSWSDQFAGIPDTCFALLFLKKTNVAQDLTATLRTMDHLIDQKALDEIK